MRNLLIYSLILTTFFCGLGKTYSQERLHMLGVKGGYNISGVGTRPDLEYKSVTTLQNYSLLYTYYHSLWGTINIFGLQTGISKQLQGYSDKEGANYYETITIPMVSQFHFDFWRMRLLINAGCFGGIRQNFEKSDGTGSDQYDSKIDLGFIAGGGLAFVLKPFELHLEGNYNYSLSYLHDPKKYGNNTQLFTYPNQLIFSLALHLHL